MSSKKKTAPKAGLTYCGGGAYVAGIPARDLTAEEVAEYGGEKFLTETRLYKLVRVSQEVKDARH